MAANTATNTADNSPDTTLQDSRGVRRAAHALRRAPNRARRIGIRGKLNLLLLLPLTAVLLVAVPFVVNEVDDARSAGQAADLAHQARELGDLVWELQRERVLVAGHVAASTMDSADLEAQFRAVDTSVEGVRAALGDASDELSSALVRIGSLRDLRDGALRRGVSLDSVARTYHAVIGALIDALRLVPQLTSDAEGTRQLTALEALLRAGEESSLRGMALIVTAVRPASGSVIYEDATTQTQSHTQRFVQQAGAEQAGLLVAVEEGEEARRVEELLGRLPAPDEPDDVRAFVTEAVAAVEAQAGLRREVQARVTNEIADAAAGRADAATTVAWTIGVGGALLFILVTMLTVAVSRSIANPLRELTAAATSVAQLGETELVRVADSEAAEEQVPQLTAIEVRSGDELGQLATAFNRVQSTAAMLVERQMVTRRNVSLMFANVAQRTQNLVGRQLALIDEVERDEQNVQLLESLYRLDHLSTRLRRTADNLLVVAGTRTSTAINAPIGIVTVLRSALAEIEDYQRVHLNDVDDVQVVSELGPDLILVFAELLENATSFSPPESVVDASSAFLPDGTYVISIVDRGIGMPPQQLAGENWRLVERERLDVVPTTVLGLFVVGRLARRHSLSVSLVDTPGGGITARVAVPPALLNRPVTQSGWPAGEPAEEHIPRALLGVTKFEIPQARHHAGFSWFPGERSEQPLGVASRPAAPIASVAPTADTSPAAPAPVARSDESRGGLRRRAPGQQLPATAVPEPPRAAAPPASPPAPRHDPVAARSAFDGYQSAVARAETSAPAWPAGAGRAAASPASPPAAAGPPPSSRGGLTRRKPGQNLATGLRNQPAPQAGRLPGSRPAAPPPPQPAAPRRPRDPEAERAAFDSFAAGFSKANGPADNVKKPGGAGTGHTGQQKGNLG